MEKEVYISVTTPPQKKTATFWESSANTDFITTWQNCPPGLTHSRHGVKQLENSLRKMRSLWGSGQSAASYQMSLIQDANEKSYKGKTFIPDIQHKHNAGAASTSVDLHVLG